MGWGLTIFGTLLLIVGLSGGQTRRGIIGTLMSAMAMVGVMVSLAGVVKLFVPGFFSRHGGLETSDPRWIWISIIFVFGLVVGSFLNVCIYRIPRGKSIILPASFCPRCGAPIHPLDNIPLLSYILLAGRCRYCEKPISPRYPLVEVMTGLLFALVYLSFGASRSLLVYTIFIAALVVVTFIDLEHRIIPDVISLPGIPAGFALSFLLPQVNWVSSLLGILLGSGLLLAVALGYEWLTHKEGMGMGDVKLLGMMGGVLGWKGVLFTIFISSVIGAAVGVVAMVAARADTKYAIPYGPFLSAGGLIYLFLGPQIIQWYLGG